ncbi:DUF5130 family protein [Nocardioides coralli]|uniref:DUF5130 family protein n=1 Tax=Nocardioides coralli TaxID=2872154 RepID=UPI001CA3D499|nr:DUF5130 family protein [Nocardioides coralli]QZY28300.1 DUF5130 domain-containing protein [Nocardioides coralli]
MPVAAGEFAAGDRHEIDKAIRAAEQTCRFEFSVFVGRSQGDPRTFAQRLHAAAVAPTRSVLVMVDPDARAVEVVTGDVVRRSLTDREVELAVLEMTSAFAEGDLVSGLRRGIGQLAEHARAQETLHSRVD